MTETTSDPGAPQPFLLGLTLAGSISAGAYLAGVVDFLVRALDAHAAGVTGEGGARKHGKPPVVLKVVSGTSGGGTSASLLVASLLDGIGGDREADRLRYLDPAGEERCCTVGLQRLFRLWVDELSLDGDAERTGMLDVADLDQAREKARPIPSLLSGLAIDRAADRALETTTWARGAPYPFLAQPLDLFVTTTNLQGVVYKVDFAAGAKHTMSRHGMARHFSVHGLGAHQAGSAWLEAYGDAGVALRLPAKDGKVDLGPRQTGPDGEDRGTGWTALRESAVASGAFPVGFPARFVPGTMGEHQRFPDAEIGEGGAWPLDVPRYGPPLETPPTGAGAATEPEPAPEATSEAGAKAEPLPLRDVMPAPDWGEGQAEAGRRLTYVAIDGGVINNEPFEYARYTLRRPRPNATGRETDWLLPNERRPDKADRAVIMVDAFPEGGVFADVSEQTEAQVAAAGLPGVLGGMLGALLAHARFKPAELVAAYDEEVKSRFMIAPSREPMGDEAPVYSSSLLACGAMGGFSGFLDRRFRVHDYILGQRNCQRFLQAHFTLDPGHLFFRNAGPWSRLTEDGKPAPRPIIELDAPLSTQIQPPALPKMTLDELEALRPAIRARAEGLARTGLASAAPRRAVSLALRAWWCMAGREQATGFVMRTLEAALVEHGVMEMALEAELRAAIEAARKKKSLAPDKTAMTPWRRKVLALLIRAGDKQIPMTAIEAGLQRAREKIGGAAPLPAETFEGESASDKAAAAELLRFLAERREGHSYRVEATALKDATPAWRLARFAGPGFLAGAARLAGRATRCMGLRR